jgi:hypothetical protein
MPWPPRQKFRALAIWTAGGGPNKASAHHGQVAQRKSAGAKASEAGGSIPPLPTIPNLQKLVKSLPPEDTILLNFHFRVGTTLRWA